MEAKEIAVILKTEGAVYMLNQLFIDLVKEKDPEKRHDIHKDNWNNILDAFKSLPTPPANTVTDEEIRELIIRNGEGIWSIGDTDLEYVDCVEITGLVRDLRDRLSQPPEREERKCAINSCFECRVGYYYCEKHTKMVAR